MSLSVSQIGDLSTASSTTGTSAKTSGDNSLDMNDFFKLLAAEMQYQDPTNPTSNDQFMAEMAQYSTLSAVQTLTKLTDYTMASGLIGQTVNYTATVTSGGKSTAETVTGKVEAMDFSSDTPKAYVAETVNGTNYGDWVDYDKLTRVYASDVTNDAYSASSGSSTAGTGSAAST